MARVKKGMLQEVRIQTSKDLFNYFKPYLKVVKECNNNDKSCAWDGTYKTLNKNVNWISNNLNNALYYRAILSDGSTIALYFNSGNQNCRADFGASASIGCGSIQVDTNGKNPPNQIGVDAFSFKVGINNISPYGLPDALDTTCNIKSTNNNNGATCTYWIINKGNMDYLRKSVSW